MVELKRKNSEAPNDSAEQDEKISLKRKVVLKRKDAGTLEETAPKSAPTLKHKTEDSVAGDAITKQPSLKHKEEGERHKAETSTPTAPHAVPKSSLSKEEKKSDSSGASIQQPLHGIDGGNNSGSTLGDEPQPSSGKGKWIVAAVIALALVAGGVYYYNSHKEGQEQIAQVADNDEHTSAENTTKAGQDSTLTVADGKGTYSDADENSNNVDDANDNAQSGQSNASQPNAGQPETRQKENGGVKGQDVSPAPKQETSHKKAVNDNYASPEPTPTDLGNMSAEQAAQLVIKGAYGNGQERKQKLDDRYAEIQHIVNEMYRTGKVN